jgi:hypothetical protein
VCDGEIAGAGGHVEHAVPGLTPAISMAKAFHVRCRPADIRSFMMSYRAATDENTSPTRRAFSFSSTC